ncbi:MAG: methyltransferase domain-containing protein [Candidatus Micrarchaeota archaeon]|nr:methyltransferase domain-containing protein [Candidatus Micrarchaeota archaeon]
MFIYPKVYRKLRRGPQVILPKDIGMILSYSGVGKESVCVDAGTGSGWLTVSLARVSKHVYGYDIRDDFLKITKHNVDLLEIDNVTLKNQDIFKKIEERNVDIVTLDMPDAQKALKNVKKALKPGGCVVSYFPNVEQVKKYVETLGKLGFVDAYTIESIVREMMIRKEGSRPSTKGLWHTGYLTFARSPVV